MNPVSNQEIIVGKGIHHVIRLPEVPAVGEELNLGSKMLKAGRYRVISNGKIEWGKKHYPHLMIELIGDIPTGESTLPMGILNC